MRTSITRLRLRLLVSTRTTIVTRHQVKRRLSALRVPAAKAFS